MIHFGKANLRRGSNIIMLVGPPACGKTTFASEIMSDYSDIEWAYISPNGIRKQFVKDGAESISSKMVFDKVYKDIEAALKDGKNVIYDATNCNKQYRKKIMRFIDDKCNQAVCLVSAATLTDCLRRNGTFSRPMKEDLIERIYIELWSNPPDISEGYSMIATFCV